MISLPGNSLLLVPGSICYPTIMVVELHEEQDLGQLLERSQKEPVLIFKHSTQCSRSAEAYEELQALHVRPPRIPLAAWFWSSKIASCPTTIEEHFGIRHESPQAIVISRGNPVWHASHFRVTAKALEDAIALQRIQD